MSLRLFAKESIPKLQYISKYSFINSLCFSTNKEFSLSQEKIEQLGFKNGIVPNNDDILCIKDRQLESDHMMKDIFAVDKDKCKYGRPRAHLRHIISNQISSGIVRLTCPHLVKAIDKLESDGKIDSINNLLKDENSEEGKALVESFRKTNNFWHDLKGKMLSEEDKVYLQKKMSTEAYDNLISSGLIGITRDKLDDVKCLHAQTADYILRRDNLIGEKVIKELELNGIKENGCSGK